MLIGQIALQHAGRPIVAMGGGPSLPADVARIRDAACWISANEHGAKLRPVDYLVCCDDIHQALGVPMQQHLGRFGVPIIGRPQWCDYRFHDIDYSGNSGMWAILAGWILGGAPVIAAGFDCYQQGGTYFHDRRAVSSSNGRELSDFMRRFESLREIVGADAVRVVSGPLLELWPQYDPGEVFPDYVVPDLLQSLRECGEVLVRFRRSAMWRGRVYRAARDYHVSESDAERLIGRGYAKRVESAPAEVAA